MKLEEKQLLFRLRTRTFEAKANFRNQYLNNLQCDYCGVCPLQTQRHLLEDCEAIISHSDDVAENVEAEHDDIFSTTTKQHTVTKLYIKVEETRKSVQN